MEKNMTESEAENILRELGSGKESIHGVFNNIIKSKDTTKTGNLSIDELGNPKLPVRTYKELALFCEDIYTDKDWSRYFSAMSEIVTSTSLSKEALLLRLLVTQKKELADTSEKTKKENKSWFKKKDDK